MYFTISTLYLTQFTNALTFHLTLSITLSILHFPVPGSIDFHIRMALPTMWSSGSKPQKRESLESITLSPAIK